jgi:prepilin-type processing-associated H-X9-DG protein/prepilin-type N-terminal cleavage/methylation domain-containing protein
MMPAATTIQGGPRLRAFTLIELLVCIGVIALLLGILLPGLSASRRSARSAVCLSNLRGLMAAIYVYANGAGDCVVPSYNMNGVNSGAKNPLDGWGPILDKFNIITGTRSILANPFCCPDTRDFSGIATGQTGTNPENPKGYMEWPAIRAGSQNYGTTIPDRGFHKILRVGYWINGDNPIGAFQTFVPGLHFTGSVGYGPDPEGRIMQPQLFSRIRRPAHLIGLADGLYSGKQEATRLGDRNVRIGYRHSGGAGMANVAFADGHAGRVEGNRFPRKADAGLTREAVRAENLGDNPTVYADPEGFLLP